LPFAGKAHRDTDLRLNKLLPPVSTYS
jgi:hypothetical protein